MTQPPSSTTTLLFLTDSHLGATEEGFQQRPRRPDLLAPLYAQLRHLVQQHAVDLLIHGGDLTEAGTAEQIEQAVALHRSLPVAQALCLGNHDLATPRSLELWRAASQGAAPWRLADQAIHLNDMDLFLLNAAWRHGQRADFYWDPRTAPDEMLLESQLAWLQGQLEGSSTRPAVLVVHPPLDALPVALTGAPEPLHRPQPAYAQALHELLDRHPRVKLVLSGHNHVTCATHHGRRVQLSSSSLIEPPFEVRLIRIARRGLEIQTVPLLADSPAEADHAAMDLIAGKAWVNGRADDRTIHLNWDE
jgi:3',5'-cyclic AMP phosphodiesterase CpdA